MIKKKTNKKNWMLGRPGNEARTLWGESGQQCHNKLVVWLADFCFMDGRAWEGDYFNSVHRKQVVGSRQQGYLLALFQAPLRLLLHSVHRVIKAMGRNL